MEDIGFASVDVLSDIARTLDVRVEVHTRVLLDGPWCLRVEPDPAWTFHLLERGRGAVTRDAHGEVALDEHDVVLVRPNIDYHVGREVGLPARTTIRPERRARGAVTIDRSTGAPDAVLVCGRITVGQALDHPLLATLPVVLHLPAASPANHEVINALRMIAGELAQGRPGWQGIVDHLSSVLFFQLMRADVPTSDRSGWTQALADPRIARAIAAVHARPEHPWTVHALAREASMSRAAFAATFTRLVGIAPIEYVTRWRMHLAINALRTERLSVGAAARRVGYRSEAAFARTFQRTVGSTPAALRRREADPASR